MQERKKSDFKMLRKLSHLCVACIIILGLSVKIFVQKNSTVKKLCHLALGVATYDSLCTSTSVA